MVLFNPYLLIAPLGMAFLGSALVITWVLNRQQSSLCNMGVGIILTSLALGIQSVLSPEEINFYAIYTSIIYLVGAWFIGRSIAIRFDVSQSPPLAFSIGGLTLYAIYYYSRIENDVSARAFILSAGLSLLQILPFMSSLKFKIPQDKLDEILYWSYIIFCFYTFLRPLMLLIAENTQNVDLIKSAYWFLTMLGSILFCMLFSCLLLASTIRSIFRKLYLERNLDPLTNLLNRRAFYEEVKLHRERKMDLPTAVLVCDIDHFKKINDAWGHGYGDTVLRNIATCLSQNTRSQDLLARFGGEEFVLFLPRTDISTAHTIALRIQEQLTERKFQLPDGKNLTLSIGITMLRPTATVDEAIYRADHQLYKAKLAGRNCIYIG